MTSQKAAIHSAREFIQYLHENLGKPSSGLAMSFTRRELDAGLTLDKEEAKRFQDTVGLLQESFAPARELSPISHTAVEYHFKTAILKALCPATSDPLVDNLQKRVSRELDFLGAALKASPFVWHVHFPVRGISPKCTPCQFGKVLFRGGNTKEIDEVASKLVSMTNDGSHDAETIENEEALREDLRKDVRQTFSGSSVARVEVQAVDDEAAKSIALYEIRRTIDTINFFADIIHPPYYKARAWLASQPHPRIPNVAHPAVEDGTWHFVDDVVSRQSVVIPEPLGEQAQKMGLTRAHTLLAKDSPEDIDKRVITAITWAGRGVAETEGDRSFIYYAIALDSLLLGKSEWGGITEQVRLRAAHLLGRDIEGRRKLSQRMKDLYQFRGNIVHHGGARMPDTALREMKHIALSAIQKVLTDARFVVMQTNDEFNTWFDDQVLSSNQ